MPTAARVFGDMYHRFYISDCSTADDTTELNVSLSSHLTTPCKVSYAITRGKHSHTEGELVTPTRSPHELEQHLPRQTRQSLFHARQLAHISITRMLAPPRSPLAHCHVHSPHVHSSFIFPTDLCPRSSPCLRVPRHRSCSVPRRRWPHRSHL